MEKGLNCTMGQMKWLNTYYDTATTDSSGMRENILYISLLLKALHEYMGTFFS